MRLFVWEDVLCDYSCGMMFAIAPNIEEARAAVLRHKDYVPEADLLSPHKEYPLTDAIGFAVWGGG